MNSQRIHRYKVKNLLYNKVKFTLVTCLPAVFTELIFCEISFTHVEIFSYLDIY